MASEKRRVELPLALVGDLLKWWEACGVSGMVIGGVAASVLGRARVTKDVDALVWVEEKAWPAFLEAGRRFGFEPRGADVMGLARQVRMLLVRHAPTLIDVDLSLGALPFEREALDRAVLVDVGGLSVPVATPEDLIVMKAIAQRPRDLLDVEGILEAQPKIDLRRVRRWVREFAVTLDSPELLDNLERVIASWRKTRPRRKRR